MRDRSTYHIEVADRLATLYVVGKLPRTAAPLIAACQQLPPSVQVLRVTLDSAEQLAQQELGVIDLLRTHWEHTRGGSLRVAFSLLNERRSRAFEVRLEA